MIIVSALSQRKRVERERELDNNKQDQMSIDLATLAIYSLYIKEENTKE